MHAEFNLYKGLAHSDTATKLFNCNHYICVHLSASLENIYNSKKFCIDLASTADEGQVEKEVTMPMCPCSTES